MRGFPKQDPFKSPSDGRSPVMHRGDLHNKMNQQQPLLLPSGNLT